MGHFLSMPEEKSIAKTYDFCPYHKSNFVRFMVVVCAATIFHIREKLLSTCVATNKYKLTVWIDDKDFCLDGVLSHYFNSFPAITFWALETC